MEFDDYGTSYYFRGDVGNNYVKFGGFYWRIVRITRTGNIKLIYQGVTSNFEESPSIISKEPFYPSYKRQDFLWDMFKKNLVLIVEQRWLLIADEAILVGGYRKANSDYYLYTNASFWLLSPTFFLDGTCWSG